MFRMIKLIFPISNLFHFILSFGLNVADERWWWCWFSIVHHTKKISFGKLRRNEEIWSCIACLLSTAQVAQFRIFLRWWAIEMRSGNAKIPFLRVKLSKAFCWKIFLFDESCLCIPVNKRLIWCMKAVFWDKILWYLTTHFMARLRKGDEALRLHEWAVRRFIYSSSTTWRMERGEAKRFGINVTYTPDALINIISIWQWNVCYYVSLRARIKWDFNICKRYIELQQQQHNISIHNKLRQWWGESFSHVYYHQRA